VHQVKIAMTNASLFAYVADGRNGLRILQLTSPETMPTYAGFSPRPQPTLIATFKTGGEALAISKALDRDRAADESGNQIAVFGRRGARPFTMEEVERMFRTEGGKGKFFTVTDKPLTAPCNPCSANSTASTVSPQIDFHPNELYPINLLKPVRAKTLTALCGLGLFTLIIGWRKLRRPSRHRRKVRSS
jgi:hypothetical protein